MASERELDVSMKCVKYMLFIANIMFALVGFLLLSIGTTIKALYTTLDHFLEEHYYSASVLAIAVGFIIFFVSLFGCAGAFRESVCLINTYALLLLCILILEIAICITTYAMRTYVADTVYYKMNETMQFYNSFTRKTWDIVQSNLECCGVNSPDDWNPYADRFEFSNIVDTRNNFQKNYRVPRTCCDNGKCVINSQEYTLYRNGCYSRIVMIVSESALLLGIATLCVCFIQILGIVFAVLLGKSVRKLKSQMLVERTEAQQQFYQKMTSPKIQEKYQSPVLNQSTCSEA